MGLKYYNSTGDSTNTGGTGSFVGTNVVPNAGYQTPIQAGVLSGVNTAVRMESYDGTIWEVCETVPSLATDHYTYTRGKLLASSTGSRINFAVGRVYIRFTLAALTEYRGDTTGDASVAILSDDNFVEVKNDGTTSVTGPTDIAPGWSARIVNSTTGNFSGGDFAIPAGGDWIVTWTGSVWKAHQSTG